MFRRVVLLLLSTKYFNYNYLKTEFKRIVYIKHISYDNVICSLSGLNKIYLMKDLHNVLTKITQLTTNIETNYPELYRSLEENPLTLPVSKYPHVDKSILHEYLESLKQLLKHHLQTHKRNL